MGWGLGVILPIECYILHPAVYTIQHSLFHLDGRTNGRKDGRTDGRKDRRMRACVRTVRMRACACVWGCVRVYGVRCWVWKLRTDLLTPCRSVWAYELRLCLKNAGRFAEKQEYLNAPSTVDVILQPYFDDFARAHPTLANLTLLEPTRRDLT